MAGPVLVLSWYGVCYGDALVPFTFDVHAINFEFADKTPE